MNIREFLYKIGFPIHVWKYNSYFEYGVLIDSRICIHCKKEERLVCYYNLNDKCKRMWVKRTKLTSEVLKEAQDNANRILRGNKK